MSKPEVVDHADMADANFPHDAEGRTYHVGARDGEVANRLLIVGSASRAERISKSLDGGSAPFVRISDRGFGVRTGTFNGVPVTIMSIGMGTAMCDFCVREVRDVVSGQMLVVRMGTCGVVDGDVPVGSVVVASKGSVMVQRNPDAFGDDGADAEHYRISKPVPSDPEASEKIASALRGALSGAENGDRQVVEGMNATACSFYASQGRVDPNFNDFNDGLIDKVVKERPGVVSLEMETFHLLDLARCGRGNKGGIRAAAVAIALAQRRSNAFLDNDSLHAIESKGGKAILEAITSIEVKDAMKDGVWSSSSAAKRKRGDDE